MTQNIIAITLLILAATANAYMDHLAFSFGPHLEDWMKKYRKPMVTISSAKLNFFQKLYYHLAGATYLEKFPLSSTVLVFLTDQWHFAQFIFLACMMSVILIYLPHDFGCNYELQNRAIDYIFLHVVFSGTKQIALTVLRPVKK